MVNSMEKWLNYAQTDLEIRIVLRLAVLTGELDCNEATALADRYGIAI